MCLPSRTNSSTLLMSEYLHPAKFGWIQFLDGLVLVPIALPYRKLRRPRLRDVLFREHSHPVERSLQFVVIVLVISIGRHRNGPADAHQRPRKGLGNHAAIPGVQSPGAIERDVKHHHRRARAAGQHHRPGLGHITRTFRSIDGERHRRAFFESTSHPKQRPYRSLRTRTAHLDEAELLHDSSRVLAVKTVAAHDSDLQVATPIHGRNHAVVPEGIHIGALGQALRLLTFPGNRKADGRPEYPDHQVRGPGNQPEQNALARVELAPRLVHGSRGGCCGGAHLPILTSRSTTWTQAP